MLVHRIVAATFIPNPNNLPVVNHKDFNPLNNSASNLEWCTIKENVNYSANQGRYSELSPKKYASAHAPKDYLYTPVEMCDLDGNALKIFKSMTEAAEYLASLGNLKNINSIRTNISSCCNGRYGYKTCGGYTWKYANKKDVTTKVDNK